MGKHISESITRTSYHIQPGDMNQYGSIHGGRLLTLADEIGFLSAYRHAEENRCLTVGVHQARFYRGAKAGLRLDIEARVALTGRTSLWVPIRMTLAEENGDAVMDAVYVYVAVDGRGTPAPIPAIIAETEEEKILQTRILAIRDAFLATRS